MREGFENNIDCNILLKNKNYVKDAIENLTILIWIAAENCTPELDIHSFTGYQMNIKKHIAAKKTA